jgi:hypothetical protein
MEVGAGVGVGVGARMRLWKKQRQRDPNGQSGSRRLCGDRCRQTYHHRHSTSRLSSSPSHPTLLGTPTFSAAHSPIHTLALLALVLLVNP